jgi:hypothetical protein
VSKRNIGLLVMIMLLIALHLTYQSESRKDILEGAYFTTGSTIMSNGQAYTVVVRLQSHDNQIHDFEQINTDSLKFSFKMVNSLFGSARLLTNAMGGNALLASMAAHDRDIAFNYAYFSSSASRLTFYKLGFDPKAHCFYIKELGRVLCLGAERSRERLLF